MTFEKMASHFVDAFDELEVDQIYEVLGKNIPSRRLDFFNEYAKEFGEAADIDEAACKRLASLMMVGYLLRALEDCR
jgi:hypothetical protein